MSGIAAASIAISMYCCLRTLFPRLGTGAVPRVPVCSFVLIPAQVCTHTALHDALPKTDTGLSSHFKALMVMHGSVSASSHSMYPGLIVLSSYRDEILFSDAVCYAGWKAILLTWAWSLVIWQVADFAKFLATWVLQRAEDIQTECKHTDQPQPAWVKAVNFPGVAGDWLMRLAYTPIAVRLQLYNHGLTCNHGLTWKLDCCLATAGNMFRSVS